MDDTGHDANAAARSSRLARRSRRRGLLALLVALLCLAGPPSTAAAEQGPPWRWPLAEPHRVAAPFDAPASPYAPGHRGVDLVGGGPVVTAVDSGVVRFAGPVAGRGVISVLHPGGIISTYEPVIASVAVGQTIAAGTVIGTLDGAGPSHCADAPCLHLGARRGETYLDPLLLLGGRGPSVLLPLDGSRGTARPGPGSGRPMATAQ